MIISGIWWLVINFVILALLYLIAMLKKPLKTGYPKHSTRKFSYSTSRSTPCNTPQNDHSTINNDNLNSTSKGFSSLNPANFFQQRKANKHLKARQGMQKGLRKSTSDTTSGTDSQNDNTALQKLSKHLENKLPDYQIQMKKNHINIMKSSKKLLMVTLDKNVAVGSRKLGSMTVVNFHKTPNHTDILAQLNSQ